MGTWIQNTSNFYIFNTQVLFTQLYNLIKSHSNNIAQLHFRILLSSSYYRLVIKCRLLPCYDLIIQTDLTYTMKIAMTYQT